MKKRKAEYNKKKKLPGVILFLCGFFLGNFIPNLMWKMEWKQKTMASVYILELLTEKKVPGRDYLIEVFRMRGSYYILCAVCGFSIFGVPVAVIGCILLGVEVGAILAMSILCFGLSGGLVGGGLLFPQYIIYIPITLSLMSCIYELSLGIWQQRGLCFEKMGLYAEKIFIGALIYTGGILLECYLNPMILEKILSFIDLF